jgi:hypothetical protein
MAPHFKKMLANGFIADAVRLEASHDGEPLLVRYPTVPEQSGKHVGNSVLVECGGRNMTEPDEDHAVRPNVAEHITELA